MRRIKREQTRIEFLKCAAAIRAAHLGAHDGKAIFGIEQTRCASANLKRASGNLARTSDSPPIDHAHHHVNGVLFETLQFPKLRDRNELSIHIKSVESLAFRPACHVGVKTFASFHQRREHLQRTAFRSRLELFHNGSRTLFFHRQIAVRTKLRSGFCEQEAKEMVNLRNRRDRRFASATSHTLLDGDGRGQSADQIDIWFFELLHELPRIRRHAVEKPALSLGE